MSYAALGQHTYDRRQSNTAAYPTCTTAAEKAKAKADCKPTVLRGLGAALAGWLDLPGKQSNRFSGANPCWVETLPNCPSCLDTRRALEAMYCIIQFKSSPRASDYGTRCHWDKVGHLYSLPFCDTKDKPPVPACLDLEGQRTRSYFKEYGSDGPDGRKNAMYWAYLRAATLNAYLSRPNCPKCLSLAEAIKFAGDIKAGRTPPQNAAWPYCSDVKVPAVPKCLPEGSSAPAAGATPGYELVQYCKKSGGTDRARNAACYLIMRSPAYWAAVARLSKCPPKCVETKTCWDKSSICVTTQVPGGPRKATGKKCPPKPPPPPPRPSAATVEAARKALAARKAPLPPPPAPPPVVAPPPPPLMPPPPAPVPTKAGVSTGSILLVAAAATAGYVVWRKSKKRAA